MKFYDESNKLISPVTISVRSDLEKDGRVTVRKVSGEALWGKVIIEETDGKVLVRDQVYRDPLILSFYLDRAGYIQLPEELKDSIEKTLSLMTEYLCRKKGISVRREEE